VDEAAAFRDLSPDAVLDAVESLGWRPDGHLLALNSYENRVYQIGIEAGPPVIGKFYRPGRWSDAAIEEEHGFTRELAQTEVAVALPLSDGAGATLHRFGPYRFALYHRVQGRPPELDDPKNLEVMGRLVARIHNVGALRPFQHRPTLEIGHFGIESITYLVEEGWLPPELTQAYRSLTEHLIERIEACFDRAGNTSQLRLHGDAHRGNILWTADGPAMVDLDDARMGPAVQDLWMFLAGDRGQMTAQLADLLAGYTQFRDFDPRELHLVEALRTLRMLHHAAWIARRWEDPAFPRAFTWFAEPRFWEEHILQLREQLAAMDEPALVWD
jgi:Ser/Thr protein kinase RdoA (MazF antagonist)